MSKFNTRENPPAPASLRGTSALATTVAPGGAPDTATREGGAGFTRTDQADLFLACTSGFITEKNFYETGEERVDRVRDLARAVAVTEEGAAWLSDFLPWLRGEGNMRTAGIVVAAEAVHARLRLATKLGGNRALVSAVCQRADEPGEFLAYWMSRFGRTKIPHAVKRGLGDAAARLYTAYSALKYDTPGRAVRFGDLIKYVGATAPVGKGELYRWLIARAPQRRAPDWQDRVDYTLLPMVSARRALEAVPLADRRALLQVAGSGMLTEAGATWEYLSGWLADGQGMDADAWRAVLPSMGYMARLRNLANFDRAGLDDMVASVIAHQLADPAAVAASRQFPYRFLSAYDTVPSDRWRHPLGKALDLSLRNIPELPGSTLVMIDTSGSMEASVSNRSARSRVDVAALFGIAVATRNRGRVDVYGFANYAYPFEVVVGGSTLREVERFRGTVGQAGHGTRIVESTMAAALGRPGGYDRVLIFTDGQTFPTTVGRLGIDLHGHLSQKLPASMSAYAFDLGGYSEGFLPSGSGNRHQLGGLTDATFRMIPQVEAGQHGSWPWDTISYGV
jgi:hypothetical protein